jgi:hypothetical protein
MVEHHGNWDKFPLNTQLETAKSILVSVPGAAFHSAVQLPLKYRTLHDGTPVADWDDWNLNDRTTGTETRESGVRCFHIHSPARPIQTPDITATFDMGHDKGVRGWLIVKTTCHGA